MNYVIHDVTARHLLSAASGPSHCTAQRPQSPLQISSSPTPKRGRNSPSQTSALSNQNAMAIIVPFFPRQHWASAQKWQRSVLDRRCILKSQLDTSRSSHLSRANRRPVINQSDCTSIPKAVLAQRRISRSSAVTSGEALRSARAR
jgi:hypothetical protein